MSKLSEIEREIEQVRVKDSLPNEISDDANHLIDNTIDNITKYCTQCYDATYDTR